MKPWKPHIYKLGRETVRRWELLTPGGHWRLEMKAYFSGRCPTLATMEWMESHPREWHVVYEWDTTNTYLITSLLMEGKPFLQFVRAFLQENQGTIREAVSSYATILTSSLTARSVR